MKVAVVQTDPSFGEKTENINRAVTMMNSVEADVYVLPELFASGYNFIDRQEVLSLAEPFPGGETFTALKKFALNRHCYVVYGFAERSGEEIYNASGMLGFDDGDELYRKIHLFDREKLFFQPGNLGFNVYETPYGHIGMMICFDWYFPESMRTLALKGAQLIVHPSNLVLPNCPDSMTVRCLENCVFAATANRIGTEDRGGTRLTYIGQSQITTPMGEILHRARSDKSGIIVHDIDLELANQKNITSRNHIFNDRRPEYYL